MKQLFNDNRLFAKAAVQFRFLPGCDFDFAGFRFIPAEE